MYHKRKQMWDQFYAEVVSDILINRSIKSTLLKKLFPDPKTSYLAIISDLKNFFMISDYRTLTKFMYMIREEINTSSSYTSSKKGRAKALKIS